MKSIRTGLTPFGKELRIFRIERGEVLYDMAQKLKLSCAYISSIETGRRKVTDAFITKLCEKYNLNDDQYQLFKNAAEQSYDSISLGFDNASYEQKNLALAFAKKFDKLDSDTIKKINKLMD